MNDALEHLKNFLDSDPDAEDVDAIRDLLNEAGRTDWLRMYESLLAQRLPPQRVTEPTLPITAGRTGRAWNDEEQARRQAQLPTGLSIPIHDGKLLVNDADRRLLTAMLLENMGIDEVLRFGDPEVWLEALMSRTTVGAGLAVALYVFTHRKSSDV